MSIHSSQMPGLRRRTFLKAACGAVGASLFPLGLGCGDDPSDPDLGGAFPVPPLLDGELVGGVRVFHLDLAAGEMEWVAGAPTATFGVNGAYLGPTLRFRRGERVRLEVTNSLGETTTLHWHGMQLPARSDGGPYQPIAAGTTWVSEYDVVQRPMTAWYHAHQMHLTARHVYMGLAGLILVEDPAQDVALPSTYGVDDLPLVIQDRRLFADGTHPYSPGKTPSMHDMMSGLRGDTLLVNGQIRPTGVVPQGLVRLRLLNGSNARIYNLGLSDDRTFLHIASDGGLLEAPLSTNRVRLAPGERAEILVDFGADPTAASVQLRSYSGEIFASLFTGMMGANLSDDLDRTTFDIMTFEIGTALPDEIVPPDQFEPIERMAEADAVRTRPIVLSMTGPTVAINGAQMTELGSVPDAINFQIRSGETEIWNITNTSGMAHPLHIHHRHFQILDVDGGPPSPAQAGWKDTVLVGPGQVIRVLLRFDGTADLQYPYMFHCHILEHEDMGMMGQFFIIDP
jgi:FtsP/CotA-like multicopper oxidase with cupredoxin domain